MQFGQNVLKVAKSGDIRSLIQVYIDDKSFRASSAGHASQRKSDSGAVKNKPLFKWLKSEVLPTEGDDIIFDVFEKLRDYGIYKAEELTELNVGLLTLESMGISPELSQRIDAALLKTSFHQQSGGSIDVLSKQLICAADQGNENEAKQLLTNLLSLGHHLNEQDNVMLTRRI